MAFRPTPRLDRLLKARSSRSTLFLILLQVHLLKVFIKIISVYSTFRHSTLFCFLNFSPSDEQKVTDANILKLSWLLPPDRWSHLSVALRIDFSTAEGIRKEFEKIPEQYIHLLQHWKAASNRTITDLNAILNQTGAGGLVDKYLD